MLEQDYATLVIEREGALVTVRIKSDNDVASGEGLADVHSELGQALSDLRGDSGCRVVVLTGYRDGAFLVPPESRRYSTGEKTGGNEPAILYRIFNGISRALESILLMDKPVIAKVNGDAMGFGQSLVFASDFIVAREDAVIVDHHMGNGEHGRGSPMGVVPGDGGIALVPLHLPPALAKEYLFLGKPLAPEQLQRLGVINYSVPLADLDRTSDDLAKRLLERSAYALAWSKRTINKTLAAEMATRLEASMAYEMVNFYQAEKTGFKSIPSL